MADQRTVLFDGPTDGTLGLLKPLSATIGSHKAVPSCMSNLECALKNPAYSGVFALLAMGGIKCIGIASKSGF